MHARAECGFETNENGKDSRWEIAAVYLRSTRVLTSEKVGALFKSG